MSKTEQVGKEDIPYIERVIAYLCKRAVFAWGKDKERWHRLIDKQEKLLKEAKREA